MFNTDSINYVEFRLLDGQVDILLKALELYAFNLHNVWITNINSDYEELRNSLLFHTYHEIMCKYSNNNYRIGYDVEKECKQHLHRNKIKKFYFYRKKVS